MKNIPKKFLAYLLVAFAFLFVASTDAFALTEEEKAEYAEIKMVGATGFNGLVINYDHGTVEAIEDEEAPIVVEEDGVVYVYTKEANQVFMPEAEDGYQLYYVDDEENHQPVNGDFNMINLHIGEHHEAKLLFDEAAPYVPTEYAVEFNDGGVWNLDGTLVTMTAEDMDFSSGFAYIPENKTLHFENFDPAIMEVVLIDGDFSTNLTVNEDNDTDLRHHNADELPVTFELAVRLRPVLTSFSVNLNGQEGQWIFDDVTVTATVQGKDLTQNPVELDGEDTIHLENFNPETMEVILYGDGGVRAHLTVDENNNTSLNSRDVLIMSENVTLDIVGKQNNEELYTLWFGAASWTIGDVVVTAEVDGLNIVNETVQIGYNKIIDLNGFNPETMKVVVEAKDGFNTTLTVSEGMTSLSRRTNEGGLPNDLSFRVVAKDNGGNEPGPGGEYNTNATITLSAGDGTYTTTQYNQETHEEEEVQKPYDTENTEILVNGSRWMAEEGTVSYNSNDEDETVDVTFATMWTDKFYENIVINGTSYTVSDYLDFSDRTAWLVANHGTQSVEFTIPNVPKSDNYEIVVKHGENKGGAFFANFLWTANPDNEFEDDAIKHAKLEFVKATYQVGDQNYTVTADDVEGNMENEGDFSVFHSADGFLTYGVVKDVDYDDGGLTLPGNSQITMRVVPDYGYQVTSVNGGENFTTTDDGVSEFTVTVPDGTNGYFRAEVTKVDDEVIANSEKVDEGNVAITTGDVKAGTVRLSVNDVELTEDKITNFKEMVSESYDVNTYLDIDLDQVFYKGTSEDVWSNRIHNLDNYATISLKLADGVNGNDIVIVHNIDDGDQFEIITIDSYDPETNIITFKTKSFSNYAIASRQCTPKTVKTISGIQKATLTKNGAINTSIQEICEETGEVIGGAGSSDPIYYPKTFTLSKAKFKYNGKVQYPTVKVVGSNGKTIAASNYTVTYSNKKSKNVGAYTITIKFKGSYYSGTQKLTYYIIPKGVTLKSLSGAKKALTAKWTKNATQTTGYQILVATDKNFTKNKKTVKVKNVKTLTKKITGLKAKTKYWVAVRTYKTVGKVTIYSAWSNIKTIKTK